MAGNEDRDTLICMFPCEMNSGLWRVRMRRWSLGFLLIVFLGRMEGADLTRAAVVLPKDLSARGRKAATVLVEEVERRSGVRWPMVTEKPASGVVPVRVGFREAGGAAPAEGYRVRVEVKDGAPEVFVQGNDERGILFGVGRLLRSLRIERGHVAVDDGFGVESAPKYPLRGHQLGYRPKCNSYDAWDLPVWDQYIRELALFGCNAIELIPPRSDDDAQSPHFPRPPMEMMEGMSRIADEYGMDVWIWYPAMDADYADPKTVQAALLEWDEVYRRLPRIDAVFVPGGDPGHTEPGVLMR
ncbi:MAG: hypothetical protein EBZ67_15255, partial [Chitinophagia bacterium]|nr:hypothetical protein [Chitinophagia bacterium]